MSRESGQRSAQLTFTAEGDSIEPGDFGEALVKCQMLLERVDEIHSPDSRRTIRWKMGSLTAGFNWSTTYRSGAKCDRLP